MQASARPSQPQTWNRYSYCINNPLVYVDPSGLIWGTKDLGNGRQNNSWFETEKEMKDAGYSEMTSFLLQDPNGGWISFDRNSNFYEHVSDFAVANGIAQGTTSLRMAGYTAKNFWIGGLLRMQAGIPDLAESFLQEINRQVSSDPALQRDLQFFAVYFPVASTEFGAAQGFSQAASTSEDAAAIPDLIFRAGRPNASNLTPRAGDNGFLSFRDSLSNPYPLQPGQKPLFQFGKDYFGINTSRLPPGSVIPDNIPPGHVSVTGVTPAELREAVTVKGRLPN